MEKRIPVRYSVTKIAHPGLIVTCVEQTLANPYSQVSEMIQAMNYARYSQSGRQHLALSQLTGLLEPFPPSWLRPTLAGRELLAQSRAAPERIWLTLMALSGYRRHLEYELLGLLKTNQRRNAGLGEQVQRLIDAAFPAFRARAAHIEQRLPRAESPGEALRWRRERDDALEGLAPAALSDLAYAQGFSEGKSDMTRATEIAAALAQAASIPLHLDTARLMKNQFLVLLLMAAARQREQGVVISQSAPGPLAQVVYELQNIGVDIRIEERGTLQVAALVPAVALRQGEWDRLLSIQHALDDPILHTVEEIAWEVIRAQVAMGADGQARGGVALEDLARAFTHSLTDGIGEFVGHSAADAMEPVASSLTIGGPLPLASDLPRVGRPYRFLDEAVQARERRTRPGVAVLLSRWLLEQDAAQESLLAIHPHLALLYVIAADAGGLADLLARSQGGWYLAGEPLVTALDARLRGLGYDVWDEGYQGQRETIHELGRLLVEQGWRCRVLDPAPAEATSLSAPTSYGYYDAMNLLTAPTTSRSVL